jgi:hypothetical protein
MVKNKNKKYGQMTERDIERLQLGKGLNVEKAGEIFDRLLAQKLGKGGGQLTEAEMKRILKNSKK